MAAKRTAKKASKTSTKTAAKKFDLRCPDCDFVAAHPMGLGRHRSTRHGMISKRQARATTSGGSGAAGAWITRQQAADRAGVHYNTVRQWERTGVLHRGSHPGARETLVSAADVARLAATRGGAGVAAGGGLGAADAARLAALERAQRDLADGLERLVGALRAGIAAAPTRGPGRPRAATPAPAATTAKAVKRTPRTKAKAAKRTPPRAKAKAAKRTPARAKAAKRAPARAKARTTRRAKPARRGRR